MTDLLILYIDSDFIYPVVASGHGAYEKYEHPDRAQRDFRLWLYFEADQAAGRVSWTKRARSEFFSGNPACRGSLFSLFGTPRKAEAEKLLTDSGLVSDLKAFFSAGGTRPETDIPTAYVFAGNISEAARRDFMAYMQSRSFATVSYSKSLEELAAATLVRGPKYGDKLVTYASSGRDLVESSFIFETTAFLLAEKPEVKANLGYNPLREAIVQYVVDKIERNQHFLVSDEERRAEIEYQKQNVDSWLRDIDLSEPASGIPFRYKGRANEYQVTVESDMLKNEQNRFVENLMQEMNSFRNRVARSSENPVSNIILIGDMFADEDFRSRVASSVGRGAGVSYLPALDYADVLAAYPVLFPALREKLADFEKVNRGNEDKITKVGQFIEKSEQLRGIDEEASDLVRCFGEFTNLLTDQLDTALAGVDRMLAESNFNGAEEALSHAALPQTDSPLFARERNLGVTVSQNNSLLSNPNAKSISDCIHSSLDEIARWRTSLDEQLNRASALRDEIARLRQVYPEYRKLMDEFESADVTRKREIVDEIKNRRLTREPLPSTGLTMPFLARIEASVKKSGGFLGFGAKKTLSVAVLTSEGYSTECKTVLLVQDSPLVTIKPANVRATIEIGFTGRRDIGPISLPLDGKEAKRLYIYLKPALDQAISIGDPLMAVKSVEIDI